MSKSGVPVPPKHTTPDNLENFARRILNMLDKNPFAMERLICRILNNKKNLQVAAFMANKVVEWNYGKPKETLKIEGQIEHSIVDPEKLTDAELAEAERLVESAVVRSDQG